MSARTPRTQTDLRKSAAIAGIVAAVCQRFDVPDRDVLGRSNNWPIPAARWLLADVIAEQEFAHPASIARLIGWKFHRDVQRARRRVRFLARHGGRSIRGTIASVRLDLGLSKQLPTIMPTNHQPDEATDAEALAAAISSMVPADRKFVANVCSVLSAREHETYAHSVRSGESSLRYIDNGGLHVVPNERRKS